jgi:hypothetical protein
VKEWKGKDEAFRIIESSIKTFKAKFGDVATQIPE